MKSDETIIEEYRDGDPEAFTELVRRYLSPMYRFARRSLPSDDEAEDVVQEIFLKAWKNLPQFKIEKKFRFWIYAIAKNALIDHLRKKKDVPFSQMETGREDLFSENLPGEEPLPDELFEKAELGALLSEALSKLPENYRTTLTLHYSEGLTFEEIAEIFDRPMNTVKSWHRRGTHSLRRFLSGPAPKTGPKTYS